MLRKGSSVCQNINLSLVNLRVGGQITQADTGRASKLHTQKQTSQLLYTEEGNKERKLPKHD